MAQQSPYPLFHCLQRVVLLMLPSCLVHDRWASLVTSLGPEAKLLRHLLLLIPPAFTRKVLVGDLPGQLGLSLAGTGPFSLAWDLFLGISGSLLCSLCQSSSPGVREKLVLPRPQIPHFPSYVCLSAHRVCFRSLCPSDREPL